MSSCTKPNVSSYTAQADLRTKQFHAVKIVTADFGVNVAGAGEGLGILMNKPNSGEQAEVALPGGGAKAKIGSGGITRGLSLKESSGKLVAASAGDRAIAIAEQSGVEDDVISVIVCIHQA